MPATDDDDEVEHGQSQFVFDVSVHHMTVSGSKFFIASFIETKTTSMPSNDQEGTDVSVILKERFKELECELVSTRVTLRETVEDLEGSVVIFVFFRGLKFSFLHFQKGPTKSCNRLWKSFCLNKKNCKASMRNCNQSMKN